MAKWEFMKSVFGDVPDDDDYDEEDVIEELEEEERKNSRSGGGLFGRKKKAEEEVYDDYDDEDDEPQAESAKVVDVAEASSRRSAAKDSNNTNSSKFSTRKGGRVMAMKSGDNGKMPEVSVMVPHSEEDATECVELLLNGISVILNLEGLDVDHAQRVIDFVSGASYATRGNFQKVSNKMFIASPPSVRLSGDFLEDLGDGFTMPSFDVNG